MPQATDVTMKDGDEARNDEDVPMPLVHAAHCRSPLRPAWSCSATRTSSCCADRRRQRPPQTWEEAMEVAVSEDARRAHAVIEIGCGGRVQV